MSKRGRFVYTEGEREAKYMFNDVNAILGINIGEVISLKTILFDNFMKLPEDVYFSGRGIIGREIKPISIRFNFVLYIYPLSQDIEEVAFRSVTSDLVTLSTVIDHMPADYNIPDVFTRSQQLATSYMNPDNEKRFELVSSRTMRFDSSVLMNQVMGNQFLNPYVDVVSVQTFDYEYFFGEDNIVRVDRQADSFAPLNMDVLLFGSGFFGSKVYCEGTTRFMYYDS